MTNTRIRYLFFPSNRSLVAWPWRGASLYLPPALFFLGPPLAAYQPMRWACIGDAFNTNWVYRSCASVDSRLHARQPAPHLYVRLLTRAHRPGRLRVRCRPRARPQPLHRSPNYAQNDRCPRRCVIPAASSRARGAGQMGWSKVMLMRCGWCIRMRTTSWTCGGW